jgi:hypothetical protein
MGNHLLAVAEIAMLNKFTQWEVTELTSSTGDETVLALLKRKGSHRITIVSKPMKMIVDIQLYRYWPKWQTKRPKLADRDIEFSEFHQDTQNCYRILGCISVHFPWNAILNLELQLSCKALYNHLVVSSATTLSNICRREYALTLDAFAKQLPMRNELSISLNGETSAHKTAITLVIAYYMHRNWGLRAVQLAHDEVDRLFCSLFES